MNSIELASKSILELFQQINVCYLVTKFQIKTNKKVWVNSSNTFAFT